MKIISSEKNKELALLVAQEAQEEILRMEKEKREDKVVALVSSVLKTLDIKDETLFVVKRQGKTFIVSFDHDQEDVVTLYDDGELLKMLIFYLFRSRSLIFPIVEQNVVLE